MSTRYDNNITSQHDYTSTQPNTHPLDDGELPEMDVSPPEDPSDESIHADRNLLNEYEKMNPRLQPLPPKAVSLDDDEIMRVLDAELPVAAPAKEEDDAALLAALEAHDRTEASLSQASAEKEAEEDIAKVLAALDADASWGAGPMQGGVAHAAAGDGATLLQATEKGPALQFFLVEVYEDVAASPGRLYLFGKVREKEQWASVCVIVQNVSHHLFFLPAMDETGRRLGAGEIREEVKEVMSRFVRNSKEIGFRVDLKKYAFEIEGIPTEEVAFVACPDG